MSHPVNDMIADQVIDQVASLQDPPSERCSYSSWYPRISYSRRRSARQTRGPPPSRSYGETWTTRLRFPPLTTGSIRSPVAQCTHHYHPPYSPPPPRHSRNISLQGSRAPVGTLRGNILLYQGLEGQGLNISLQGFWVSQGLPEQSPLSH